MKKIILVLMFCLLNVLSYGEERNKTDSKESRDVINNGIKILYTSERYDVDGNDFGGYIQKDDGLYINMDIYMGKSLSENHVFKYSNGKLIDLKLTEKEVGEYFKQAQSMYDLDSKDNRIIIDEKRYIKLGGVDNPRITLVDGKKERYLQGYVFSTPRLTYMYLDKENEKLYFVGGSVKASGIMEYDIETGDVKVFAESHHAPRVKDYSLNNIRDLESFRNPIRVPNTPYLLFFIEKRVNNKYFFEIGIKEVPEWKSELEKKGKTK
jgi:hypothetical protein